MGYQSAIDQLLNGASIGLSAYALGARKNSERQRQFQAEENEKDRAVKLAELQHKELIRQDAENARKEKLAQDARLKEAQLNENARQKKLQRRHETAMQNAKFKHQSEMARLRAAERAQTQQEIYVYHNKMRLDEFPEHFQKRFLEELNGKK